MGPSAISGVHVAPGGGAIDPAVAVQSLVEHLGRWRDCVQGHGLVLLEVHCLKPATTRRLHHETEALHFDAYHAFSGQHLVEASTFLLAAAEAGLVPHTRAALRFPRLTPYTRITLNRFFVAPYAFRLATPDDLPALLAIEEAAQSEELRSSPAQIERRLAAFPEGQLVAERDGEVIGVLYTQRIARADALAAITMEQVETLHEPGGPLASFSVSSSIRSAATGSTPKSYSISQSTICLSWMALSASWASRAAGITRKESIGL